MWEKMYYENSNKNKAGVSIYKAKQTSEHGITRDKGEIMMNGLIH